MQKSKQQTLMMALVAGLVAVAPLTAGAQDKTDKAVDKTKERHPGREGGGDR